MTVTIQLIRRRRRGPSTPTEPPVLGTPVASSPTPTSGANVPANAIDGNLSTYWQHSGGIVEDPQLVLTFPAPGLLSGIGITFFHVVYLFIDYTIETWNGTAWVVQATVVGNAVAVTDHPITPVVTDRVRIVATEWTSDNVSTYGAALKEVTWR